MSIKIGLSKVLPCDPLGTLIQAETWENYCHAFLIIDDLANIIVEEHFGGVRQRQLANSELNSFDVYEFNEPLASWQEIGILRYCREALAAKEPYAVKNLFEFNPVFRAFLGEPPDLTRLGELQAIHRPAICSQFVVDALAFGATIRLLDKPDFKTAPGDLPASPLLRLGARLSPVTPNGAVDVVAK